MLCFKDQNEPFLVTEIFGLIKRSAFFRNLDFALSILF